MDWSAYDAVLFDLDGVITPTAEVHMRAWKKMFDEFLAQRGVDEPYTDDDYFTYVDGKPRYDGVRSFLASRDITVPDGDPSDPSDAETVCGLGNRKNDVFSDVLRTDGMKPFPGSLKLVLHLQELGLPMAIVSSSKNAPEVLEVAELVNYFDEIVDGNVSAERGLAGKPAPDTFLFAAEALGVNADRSVVFEDALSGVAAGHAGGFALVVGVDRGVGADNLISHGADRVVADLEELL